MSSVESARGYKTPDFVTAIDNVRSLWSVYGGEWTPAQEDKDRISARYCLSEHGLDAVLAVSHYLELVSEREVHCECR